MNHDTVNDAWTTLGPTAPERQRIDARVAAWLDAYDTSLAGEWLGLVRHAPLPALGLATLSAASIVAAPPLVWFARALM